MQFYSINSKRLLIQHVSSPMKSNYNIPIKLKPVFRNLTPLEGIIYFEIFYRAQHAEDRRKGIVVAYKLFEPDPMIIAIAYIMWEGIVQGIAWDVVKGIVLKNIDILKRGIWETSLKKQKTKSTSKIEIGLGFTRYTNNEKKLYDMFIGLRRVANKLNENSKRMVSINDVASANKINVKKRLGSDRE